MLIEKKCFEGLSKRVCERERERRLEVEERVTKGWKGRLEGERVE